MTFTANQYNEKKPEPASGAEESFSGTAHKADPGKTLSAHQQQLDSFNQLKAAIVARSWIDAAIVNGMYCRDDHQKQLLVIQVAGPAGTNRRIVEAETKKMLWSGKQPASNRKDWEQAIRRLQDLCDAANESAQELPADKRPRWYLTDVDNDVTTSVVTFDRQEAADRQKDGWSVVGHEVDDDLWRDERSGHWFRQYVDGTYGKVDVRGLSEWKQELEGGSHDVVA